MQMESRNMTSAAATNYKFETLDVSLPRSYVLHVKLNRPEQLNTMNAQMWNEMIDCFRKATSDSNVRSIVLSGNGRMFTAGLDLMAAASTFAPATNDVARKAFEMIPFIQLAQDSCTVIEKCTKPVICAIHGACIGGGMDIITACDIRYCTKDSYFSVKEVDVGLAADMGTLQRLPRVIGNDSLVRELCYTARKMGSEEANSCGLVGKVFDDQEVLLKNSLSLAEEIASKSPIAVQSTKVNLNYSRNHSIDESLEYMRSWNAAMLQTEDIMKSAQALMTKKKLSEVDFAKL